MDAAIPNPVTNDNIKSPFVFALPKGRVMAEAVPLLKKIGIALPDDFLANDRRRLVTTLPFSGELAAMADDFSALTLVEVKNWDVFSFVATGSAVVGILGRDIWEEKLRDAGEGLRDHRDNIYVPLDLGIGKCRLSTARLASAAQSVKNFNGKKIVASKYPNLARAYYHGKNQAIEVMPLSGSLELAPTLGLADEIVDLVATGQTLKDNHLLEENKILDVTSLLMVNRVAYKTHPKAFAHLLAAFKSVL
ncbi:MAG: ATP phosphoribosyltransferase [Hydrotalea sp.]|nr:ATP phosphoribosyltransferase [Hydrotalea sp.]